MPSAAARQLADLTRDLVCDLPVLKAALPSEETLLQDQKATVRREVYLLGTIKSGKSTLANALLGGDLMPRGAGVKTFVLTRARRAERACSRILFESGALIRDRLAFDFRMLGFAAEVPEMLYSEAGTATLSALLEEFERSCQENERLADVDADAPLLGLVPRSLARVRRSIIGFAELCARCPDELLAEIARNGCLEFLDERFDDYRAWTDSMDLAALIRAIELELPVAAAGEENALPDNIDLVDCQGSDSLNALDFADIESVAQRADTIIYVVQSRLGLRQGDRDLLRHLVQVGAAGRVLPVLNVDAFDPLDRSTFENLFGKIQADLTHTLGAEEPLLAVVGLAELDAVLGDDEELELMATLWRRREAMDVFEELRTNIRQLRERLRGLVAAPGPGEETNRHLRACLQQCRSVAAAALDRDALLLGTDASGMAHAEALAAVQRILDGESRRLHEDARAQVEQALAPTDPLCKEIDKLLAEQGGPYLRRRPVPTELLGEKKAQRVLDAALATFNGDWLGTQGTLRQNNLAGVRRWLLERLESTEERIMRMLPDCAKDAVGTHASGQDDGLAVLPGNAGMVRQDPRRAIEHVMERTPVPRLLSPIVLAGAIRQGLMTLFVSRHLISRLRRDGQQDPSKLLAQRVELLWRQTLGAAFRRAEADFPHALANARENFKFQYCYRIADSFLDLLMTEISADIERHYAILAQLAEGEQLLLSDATRAHVECYLAALEQLAEQPAC